MLPHQNVVTSQAVVWQDDHLRLLDQRVLPHEVRFLDLYTAEDTARAIKDMVVRGAPAIGITAAYGVVLAARTSYAKTRENWRSHIGEELARLEASRPTAVNLYWALQRMGKAIATIGDDEVPEPRLLAEAEAIHQADYDDNMRMGDLGASLITRRTNIITHCNAGAIATGGYGTALGVVRSASRDGHVEHVYADETRPWFQGTRLTAWELAQDSIPVSVLADGAAASRMRFGDVDWVIVGSDRISANGDVANKIGTYGLAINARFHNIGFMVVAPTSTIDMATATGTDIPIENRRSEELLNWGDRRIAATGTEAWNPVFDVTPASLVTVLVTEKGVIESPDAEKIEKLMS